MSLAFVTAYNFAKHLKALKWRTALSSHLCEGLNESSPQSSKSIRTTSFRGPHISRPDGEPWSDSRGRLTPVEPRPVRRDHPCRPRALRLPNEGSSATKSPRTLQCSAKTSDSRRRSKRPQNAQISGRSPTTLANGVIGPIGRTTPRSSSNEIM